MLHPHRRTDPRPRRRDAWTRGLVSLLVLLTGTRALAQDPAAVRGGLTADQIRSVIQSEIGMVQRCYELALQRTLDATGRVTVVFVISPEGTVSRSEVADSTLGDALAGRCIAEAIATWEFPRPEPPGPVQVRFPFNLSFSDGSTPQTRPSAPRLRRPIQLLSRGQPPRTFGELTRDAAAAGARLDSGRESPAGIDPNVFRAHARYATALAEQLDDAVDARSRACARRPRESSACRDAEHAMDVARDLHRSGLSAMKARLRRWLAAHPDGANSDHARFVLAMLAEFLGELELASDLYAMIAEHDPASAFAGPSFAALAAMDFRDGRYQLAAERFESAAASTSVAPVDRAFALAFRGAALEQMGQRAAALESYEAASLALGANRALLSDFAPNDAAEFESLVEHRTSDLLRAEGTAEGRSAAVARWSVDGASTAQREALHQLTRPRVP